MKRKLLSTPVASDATMGAVIGKEDTFRVTSTGMPRKVNRNGQDGSVGLVRLVKLWDLLPTPTATDATRGGEIVTGNRTSAFEWASGMRKLHFVILGDDCKFRVICPADASRLIKAGYEYAK